MKVGSLVNHDDYFGVGIVIGLQEVEGKTQWLIHWLRDGKNFGWTWVEGDKNTVEVICK